MLVYNLHHACDIARCVSDAERDSEIRLVRSGEVLNKHTIRNPMIVVCNYIFDTLRQDAFRIVEGQLQEALCTVISEQPEPDPTHPDVIKRMRYARRWPAVRVHVRHVTVSPSRRRAGVTGSTGRALLRSTTIPTFKSMAEPRGARAAHVPRTHCLSWVSSAACFGTTCRVTATRRS